MSATQNSMQIVTKDQPFVLDDFRQGRIAAISNFLTPQNSVQNCINVNFDTIIGAGVVRPGTTTTGTVASAKTPLGLNEFVGKGGSPNLMVAVFKGASNATAYYYNGTWHASNKTSLSNSAKDRFDVLGGSVFMTNSSDGMFDSADGATYGTTNSITTVKPSLVHRYNARMLASGDPTYPSRVYFSSIVDPTSSPFITWNVDNSTGDFIDINPDDGGQVTAFADTSTFCLVFKGNGMYRLDTVNKSTDPNNIFNIGAISQEAVVACQGIVYFFSGIDIRQTDGGFPQQISRAAVQDIIDAIPQASWSTVAAGTDGWNVYFSVGTVTLNANTGSAQTITNCVLKFSTRDQAWSVHSYASLFEFFCEYTDSSGRLMRGADTGGLVQTINKGTTDNSAPIFFSMETQDEDFGNRAHLKSISDKIVAYTQNAVNSSLAITKDGVALDVDISLTSRVNYSNPVPYTAHFFTFKWYGASDGKAPVFYGVQVESVTDLGLTK